MGACSCTEGRVSGAELKVAFPGRYRRSGRRSVGEGAHSTCYPALDQQTGKSVAMKEYKFDLSRDFGGSDVLARFKREVETLSSLQESISDFDHKPSELFVQLLDYSRDSSGQAGPDACTGKLFVVMELADGSLKDQIRRWRREATPFAERRQQVQSFVQDMVQAVAGLHARGLVHLDLKPENFLLFGGRLKLGDVDGCVPIGAELLSSDPNISFSPIYCAPEFARFIMDEEDRPIHAEPSLDVWSVAATACEAAMLEPLLAPRLAQSRQDTMSFLHWLAHTSDLSVPPMVRDLDTDLYALLGTWLRPAAGQRAGLEGGPGHAYLDRGCTGGASKARVINLESNIEIELATTLLATTFVSTKLRL